MNSERIELIKNSLRSVSKVFVLGIIGVLFLAVYFLGMVNGYVQGKQDAQYLFLGFYDKPAQKPSLTPSPTDSVTPTVILSHTPTSQPGQTAKTGWDGAELWEAVNAKRKEYGVNPLNRSGDLCTLASIRLNELLELGSLDGHQGFGRLEKNRPDLKWIFSKYSSLGEFLAIGGKSPGDTIALWDDTTGHKKLLNGGEYVWGCIYTRNSIAVAITAY